MPASFSFEPRLLELAVHDLRNSLNSINMALHLIEGELPEGNDDLRGDVLMLSESVNTTKRMVQYLGDYCHLFDSRVELLPSPFNPRSLLQEVAEGSPTAQTARGQVRLEIRPDCPQVVELVPNLAAKAIEYALANAVTAARGGAIRLAADGDEDRWVLTITVDEAPDANIRPGPIQADDLERLVGNHRERRGLDLAIAARVSELFGGSTRLEVKDGQATSIVLDWPTNLQTVP